MNLIADACKFVNEATETNGILGRRIRSDNKRENG